MNRYLKARKVRRDGLAVCLFCLTACSAALSASKSPPLVAHYAITDRIAGSGTDWDYLSVDPAARRLYIAQQGVAALDLTTHQLTTQLVSGQLTHGVLPIGDGIVAVDDSAVGTLTLFEGATGKVRATVAIPNSSVKKGFHDPDALALDAKTNLLIAVNGDSGELVLVDTKSLSVAGTIPVGGDLEFAVPGIEGLLYVNVASTNEIAVVDIAGRTVLKRFPLKGCE